MDRRADDAMRNRIARQLFDDHAAPFHIGRFLVDGVLGRGSMGVVYRATDPQLERRVALKLVHEGLVASRDRERFAREGMALARLSHPNVVQLYEIGTHEDALFLVMECVDGVPLDAWQRAAERSVDDIVDVYLQAMAGLDAAHRASVVHRDFKPANVLVATDGRVRVVDFGLARPRRVDAEVTEPPDGAPDELHTVAAGTPAYMAPEQSAGHIVDPRSDQFSLCTSMYEAVFGTRPFAPLDVRRLGLEPEVAIPPRRGPRRGPGWLRRILLRGLAADPAHR